MSIFVETPIPFNIEAFRTGLAWAQSWTSDGAVLCLLERGKMSLVAIEEKRFLASWSHPMEVHLEKPAFFLIPRFAVQTLSGAATWNATGLDVMLHKNLVGIILREGQQEFRLQWRWTAAQFHAPALFRRMNRVPATITQASYIKIADIAHLAIARLMQPQDAEELKNLPENDAILLDFASQTNTEKPTTAPNPAHYYFNSRMIIRGLEIVRENQIGFSIQPINQGAEAILTLACKRGDWQIHCAALSIGVKTEQAPQAVMAIRETSTPMMDGAWILPSKR